MEDKTHSNGRRGKRERSSDSWWQRHRAWVAGMTRGQKIRYRILQVATVISAIIVLIWAAAMIWIREPTLPQVDPGASGNTSTGDESTTLPGAEEVNIAASGRREGVYTFLLVGQDTGGGGNTDTMILATFDTQNKTVHAMSLPRDTMINVSWNTKKLNTVYNYYKGRDPDTQVEKGMAALKEHVGKLTGIVPDFYVIIQWDAVGELVDALGGVTFDVPYNMDYDDPWQDLHIHQEKGERLLSGDDAMQVIRWRQNNRNSPYGYVSIGDAGRMEIQQDFLMAVARECLKLENLLNAPEFARIFTENVTTDLPIGNLIWFAQQAIGMNADEDVHFATLPYTGYNRYFGYNRFTSYVLPVADELVELVNDGFNPYLREVTLSDLELLVLHSDGSLSVTSGSLADPQLAEPGHMQSSYSNPNASSGGGTQTGGSSSGGESQSGDGEDETQTGDTSQEEVPSGGDTSQGGSQTGGDTSQDGEQTGGDTSQGGSQTSGDTSQGGAQTGGDTSQGDTPITSLPGDESTGQTGTVSIGGADAGQTTVNIGQPADTSGIQAA